MKQKALDQGIDRLLPKKRYESWWPGLRSCHLGMYRPDATLDLGGPEIARV